MTRDERLWLALRAGEPVQHVRAYELARYVVTKNAEVRAALMRPPFNTPEWRRAILFGPPILSGAVQLPDERVGG